MANQDFDINIRVNANTAQVDAIRQSFEKLGAQVRVTNAEAAAGGGLGGGGGFGSAVGAGTVIALVTGAIRKWEEFNTEQDKVVDGMIKAQEKSHELGLAVADMMDAMKSAERIDTEPLQVSFDRLTQKVRELKTQMKLAFEAGEYEDVKKIAGALGVVESQLDRVTSAMDKQTASADRLAKAREKAAEKAAGEERAFGQSAFETASPQAKAILDQEAAAKRATAAGDERSAAQFQQTGEALRRGATPDQISEANQLGKLLQDQNLILGQIRDAWR